MRCASTRAIVYRGNALKSNDNASLEQGVDWCQEYSCRTNKSNMNAVRAAVKRNPSAKAFTYTVSLPGQKICWHDDDSLEENQ